MLSFSPDKRPTMAQILSHPVLRKKANSLNIIQQLPAKLPLNQTFEMKAKN
jgi:hypothetical protein